VMWVGLVAGEGGSDVGLCMGDVGAVRGGQRCWSEVDAVDMFVQVRNAVDMFVQVRKWVCVVGKGRWRGRGRGSDGQNGIDGVDK
jgi:hypothetical protein